MASTLRPCPVCGQPHNPKRAQVQPPRLKDNVKPKLPGDYHCPRCGQVRTEQLRRDVLILCNQRMSSPAIARRLGLRLSEVVRILQQPQP